FNAPQGKTDPQAELDATLAAFFALVSSIEQRTSTQLEDPRQITVSAADDHPQCKFVARYYWLKSVLDFDRARLPEVSCHSFNEWFSLLKPQSVTLAYPSAYLNIPSSMFGHTLIRIDGVPEEEGSPLLAY